LSFPNQKKTVLPIMKIETFTGAILQKMSGIGKSQFKFMVHIVHLFLCMRGRKNYKMMARYGTYNEQTYRQNFAKNFDFKAFNRELIQTYCGSELAWIFDPSYIAKSGKQTPGTGYFWSGCAGSPRWGLEIGALGVADILNHTGMHYNASQTQFIKGEESLRAYYAKQICDQAKELQKITKVMIFDAFFSKYEFVKSITSVGFTLISRMASNSYMRYAYTGPKREGRGKQKEYDGQIDIKNVNTGHFKVIKSDDDEIVYEGLGHIRSLKLWCKIVIVNTLKDGKVHKAFIYFSTDKDMLGTQVLHYYRIRYQIEFLFRDAKGFLGLEDTQSRQEEALDFHFNISLSTLNIAKAMHWLSIPKKERGSFSMADIKTQYINELVLDKLISIYGKDPSVEKENPEIRELYQLGRIAA
jgi:hypothetical protein